LSEVLTSGGSKVKFPEETENFHKTSQLHPVFHPTDTEGGVSRLKRPERKAGHSSPSSSEVKKIVDLCSQFPIRFPDVTLKNGLIQRF